MKIIINKQLLKANRLCADIVVKDKKYNMWFEVDHEYIKYITYERADAFVVAILAYAIKKELDIEIKDKISSRLYYQLTTYLIPMLCKKFNKRIIKIYAELDSNSYNVGHAVGTGISCGIDSFYTIKKHIDRKENEFNLTHLTFFNAGASGQYGGDEARRQYKERMKSSKKFAEENNFKFVSVDSNMNEFLMMNHEKTHTFRSLACVLLLQKLFSKYYYSSGLEFDDTRIDEYDTACYDILNMQCLSTEDITFYSTGMETNRIGKVKEISQYKPSYKYLNVCVAEDFNCGECEKCLRTLLELDAIEKLDLYKNVFDIEKYKKNRNKHLRFLLRMRKKKNIFYIESYSEFVKNKKRIPLSVRFLSYIPSIKGMKNFIYNKVCKIFKINYKDKIDDGWSIK